MSRIKMSLLQRVATWRWKKLFVLVIVFMRASLAESGTSNQTTDGYPLLLRDMLALAPPFTAGSPGSRCQLQSQRFLKALKNLDLWAVKMYDSSGKMLSGLLNGNVHAFGDFWQCLDILETLPGDEAQGGGRLAGKYCQVEAFVELEKGNKFDGQIAEIMEHVLSHRAIQNNHEDGVKFFPSFTPMTWGFCVPDSCSHADVERTVAEFVAPHNRTSGLVIQLKSNPHSCEVVRESRFTSGPAMPVVLFFSIVTTLGVLGTLIEMFDAEPFEVNLPRQRSLSRNICLAFSFRRNWKTLFDTRSPADDIGCVHGIRFIFSMSIYLLHRGVFGMFVPFSNRTYIAKTLEGDWTMVFRAFWNNVDSFVVLSGLLTSFYCVKKLQSGQKINILLMYIQRYYKFTPMFIVSLLMIRNIAIELRTGPNAMRVVKHFVLTCQENFWKNFLYAGNLDGMNGMCYPPSHQLITDMQMYWLSPFVVLLLWRFPRRAMLILAAIILSLTVFKGLDIYYNEMGSFIYYGATLQEMLTSADRMYLNPLHRLTPYLFGVGLGFYLRTKGKHAKLTLEHIHIGWCTAILAGFYSFFGPRHAAKRGYQFDAKESALFGMLQPLLWSSALCWVIYVCYIGKGGAVNRFLSWRGFVVFTKLSYSFYLTQIMVIFWGIAGSMTPEYMRMHQIIDFNELAVVLLMSLGFTLLFLLPLGGLHQLIFPGRPQRAKPLNLAKTLSIVSITTKIK